MFIQKEIVYLNCSFLIMFKKIITVLTISINIEKPSLSMLGYDLSIIVLRIVQIAAKKNNSALSHCINTVEFSSFQGQELRTVD